MSPRTRCAARDATRPTPVTGPSRQHLQRGGHRGGIGVEGVVDQVEGQPDPRHRPAPPSRACPRPSGGAQRPAPQRRARSAPSAAQAGQHRQRVHGEMPPRRGRQRFSQGLRHASARATVCRRQATSVKRAWLAGRLCRRTTARPRPAAAAGSPRDIESPFSTAVPPGSQPCEDRRLLVRDPVERAEGFQMRRRDRGDQRVGPGQRASGAISPGWFMPISITAKSVSAGIRASVSGTPQWLL